jgi:putative holliday junction resolvase
MTPAAPPHPLPSAPAPDSARSSALSYLAFDFGLRRVGVASGNSITRCATPLRTLVGQGEQRFEVIAALIEEWRPDALVVGVPLHPDGAAHENTARAQRFARQLEGRFGLAVYQVDERYTTTQARAAGAKDLDAAAAAIILEQFLHAVESAQE